MLASGTGGLVLSMLASGTGGLVLSMLASGAGGLVLSMLAPGTGGLVLGMLASGTQDRGFEPGRRHLSHVADLRHVKEPCDLRGSRNRRPN
jgi:hypothetical protein